MESEVRDGSLSGGHILRKVCIAHVSLPKFARFPVLLEQEMSRILIVLFKLLKIEYLTAAQQGRHLSMA